MSKNSEAVVRAQKRKKSHAIEYLGGKCSICGYDRCEAALDFHHTDPSLKKFSPTYIVHRWSWDRVKKELDKCLLVCSNCHREIHFGMHSPEYVQRFCVPPMEKICETCEKPFLTRNKDQINCSNQCRAFALRRADRPDKETLAKLIQQESWLSLGRRFGVSDNAVRKWAKRYELI